jgi:hypothetical protein
MKPRTRFIPVITVLALTVMACTCIFPELGTLTAPTQTLVEPQDTATTAPTPTATSRPSTPTPEQPTPTVPAVSRGPGFAEFVSVPVSLPEAWSGYALPVAASSLPNSDLVSLSQEQNAVLGQNGFVVVPADWPEFYQLYDQARYFEIPVFVTTDSVLHVYHLIFDKMLRDLERDYFEPDIRALTAACLAEAQSIYSQLQGTDLEDVARSVVAYFAVADALIDPDSVTPDEVASLVDAEVALVQNAGGFAASPIFSRNCPATCNPCDTEPPPECVDQPCLCEDYSQYKPRGHYTRSEQLERYFRTMMWYGRINLRLQRPDETRAALIITYILRNADVDGTPAAEVWARVYDPTVFIVGKADDLGFHEYGTLWDAVFGPAAAVSSIGDEAQFAAFVQAARELPPPQINSMWVYIFEDKEAVTQGFRFMGQRFVLDAYILDEMTWREVGTLQEPRMMPTALDVMAALGSDEAYDILDDLGETSYVNYTEQMTKLRGEISALQLDSWTQNLYWAWLYCLDPLLQAKGAPYPPFMRNEAWTRRDLQTALGSWTELKHDTILYAKQAMAELGGGPPPAPPHGWVEPNPELYARLLALTRMTHDGLASRDLLNVNTEANLARLDDLLDFLLDVAQRELAGEQLTEEDYDRIKYYGGELEAITLAAADATGEGRPFFEQDERAALVADVFTDPSGYFLEEAIGPVFEIYVVIPDGTAGVHIAKGGVFSYYEFPRAMEDGRLTDEEWYDILDSGDAPDQPTWTEAFTLD